MAKQFFCLKMISVDEDDNDDKVAAAPSLSSLHMRMFLAEDGQGGTKGCCGQLQLLLGLEQTSSCLDAVVIVAVVVFVGTTASCHCCCCLQMNL